MKKLFLNPVILLTLIASMLFVSSCEESAEVVEADLIGAWDIGQVNVDVKVGPVKLVDFLISTLQFGQEAAQELVDQITTEFYEIKGGTVTFNKDYSYLMSRNDLQESGTWKLEGDQLYMNISDQIEEEAPLTIQSMNSSAAIVAWEQEQPIPVEGIGEKNATIVIELNLSRQ
jgi:hypothetical protein